MTGRPPRRAVAFRVTTECLLTREWEMGSRDSPADFGKMPPKCAHLGLAATGGQWKSVDIEDKFLSEIRSDLSLIISPQRTSLDIPERLWMVGRVALAFSSYAPNFTR
jgi:hypothetical protein